MEMELEANDEAAESSSVGTTSSRKNTSKVWLYFTKVVENGKERAKCNKCKQTYAVNGTSNMLRHQEQYCKFRDPANPTTGNATFSQDVFRDILAKAVIKHNQPFKSVEYKGYREVYSYLNPQVKPITRNTSKADICKIYQIEKEKLKKMLASLNGRICLTSDLWTSVASNGYMTVTAHYVDNDWVLQSKVLIFRHVPPSHDGPTIGEKLVEFIQEWGIEKKVFTLTLDNAKYNDGVVDLLRNHQRLTNSSICNGKYVHIRCGAHILNLVVQSGLKTIDESLYKIRESVKYVRGSEARTMKFVECVKHLGLETRHKLVQDLPIRWNSTYLMIESALRYKYAFLSLGLFDSKYILCPSNEEWGRVERIAEFLQPFYEMTELFSGTQYPTANLYFMNVWKIQVMLQEVMKSGDLDLKNMAKSMKPKFDKYWEDYSTILTFAVVLDPRYKLKFVKFCYEKLDKNTAQEKLMI